MDAKIETWKMGKIFAKVCLFALSILLLASCDLLSPTPTETPQTSATTQLAQGTALSPVTPLPTNANLPTRVSDPTAQPTATSESVATETAEPMPTETVVASEATVTATATNIPSTSTPLPTTAPTATALPTPLPTIVATPDEFWSITYFANDDLSGPPIRAEQAETVGHRWGYFRPAGIPDSFSVRWRRSVQLSQQSYRVYVWSPDGVRIRINDVVILEDWETGPMRLNEFVVGVEDGSFNIEVEHFQAGGLEDIFVWWTPLANDSWLGSYWNNLEYDGEPVLVREDASIEFDWGQGSASAELPSDAFAARWSRTVDLPAGVYQFAATYDDGVRVYVNGILLIDDWLPGIRRDATSQMWLPAGSHQITVEYFERQGDASISFAWEKVNVPASSWSGTYYANVWLAGNPVQTSQDLNLDFDWGQQGALANLPADQFSIRWLRQFNFEAGLYKIITMSDDGVRVFVDGELILDHWSDNLFDDRREIAVQLEGVHLLEILYYENSGSAGFRFSLERLGPLIE